MMATTIINSMSVNPRLWAWRRGRGAPAAGRGARGQTSGTTTSRPSSSRPGLSTAQQARIPAHGRSTTISSCSLWTSSYLRRRVNITNLDFQHIIFEGKRVIFPTYSNYVFDHNFTSTAPTGTYEPILES